MSVPADLADDRSPGADPAPTDPPVQWSRGRAVAFRFLFVIGAGILALSIYGNLGLVAVFHVTKVNWLIAQVGSFAVRGRGVDVFLGNTGDPLWVWCLHLGWIILSVPIVAVWTYLDRRRANYRSLLGLLGVLARAGLALNMLYYGLAKVFPVQMGFMIMPAHQTQLVGDTSMFNTLWDFMGASTPYSVTTGLIEIVAGILLLWRRTSLPGALLSIVASVQILLLNLFYDVPVKILATELVIISVALTIPYWQSLIRVFLNRSGAAPIDYLPVAGARNSGIRIVGLLVKYLAVVIFIVSGVAKGVLVTWVIHTPRSPLDGVWRATSVTIDGAPARLDQRAPAPWSTIAITLRGSESNAAVKAISSSYDSVVTQEPSGYVTAWSIEREGDVFALRKHEGDDPLRVTITMRGDDLQMATTLDGRRVEGTYTRRFMERDRSHFRLITPDDFSAGEPGGS